MVTVTLGAVGETDDGALANTSESKEGTEVILISGDEVDDVWRHESNGEFVFTNSSEILSVSDSCGGCSHLKSSISLLNSISADSFVLNGIISFSVFKSVKFP